MNIFIGFCAAFTITVLLSFLFGALGIIEETKYLIGWWSACGYIFFSKKHRNI